MRRAVLAWIAVVAAALAGCGGSPTRPDLTLNPPTVPADPAALQAAVEAFYAAEDPDGLRAAVSAAQAAGAQSAAHHAIAAELAHLEDRPRAEIQHLLAGLLDPQGVNGRWLLHRLVSLDWTIDERARIEGVLAAVAREHKDPDVAAMAGWMLAHARHLRGDLEGMRAAMKPLGFRPPLAVIGTWDNDQGKGFDQPQGPEREVDLSARYDGSLVEVGWREGYPMDPRGKVDLGRLLHPVPWQVAFAAAGVKAKEAGAYELRLSTSDPIKVWVNDQPVFEGRRLSRWVFDGVVIPVTLRKGFNRVLVKTGNRAGESWMLVARITRPAGVPVLDDSLSAAPADGAVPQGEGPGAGLPEAELVARRVAHLPPKAAQRHRLAMDWAHDLGLEVLAVKAAEDFLAQHPKSLIARYEHAMALWNNQERGRTADLLNALEQAYGAALPRLALKQARFWRQQKLMDKSRALLLKTRAAHPDRPGAARALADLFRQEKWHEDRCALLAALNERTPRWPAVLQELASCKKRLSLYPQAEAIYRTLLGWLPNDLGALNNLQWLMMGNDAFDEAQALAARAARGWPHVPTGWIRLGEARRRAGDLAGAASAWRRLIELSPVNPDAFERLARLAMQQGDTAEAVAQWRAALIRDPENEAISHRLDYLDPAKTGPWAADIPDEKRLDGAVAARATAKPGEGADVIYLMDDEVTALGPDGSSVNHVTMVAHAVNQAGRDRLTRMRIRSGGRHRVLHAYAVAPSGERIEASSIRQRTVRFRKLSVGSTVVLQYRIDERPDGYLAGHMARQWWFQGPGVHTHRGRWVLYAPKGVEVLQERLRVDYTQRAAGDLIRHEWAGADLQPLITEPGMPTFSEVAAHVVASTVPDWETFWNWERELLRDAFRDSPELRALAERILAGAATTQEKVDRIHAYLMTDIRYQQDYEKRIAGVKPHAAPVVVARQYGDCKDKAVLFITLARLAGIKVHFALVRTRDAGPVRREVPMQQFNHAIVYVPKQDGLPEGRFYDPTVDALDVQVLRHDDQGTWSLVFDPVGDAHAWRQIPYQAASVDDTLTQIALDLAGDGKVTGELALQSRGRLGSFLRKGARNKKKLEQALEQQVARTFPGGRMLGVELAQVTDVFQPARVQLKLESSGLVRKEGEAMRLKLPAGWRPEGWFRLAERTHPLLFGSPRTMRWEISIQLPAGAKVQRLPEGGVVESECIKVDRSVTAKKGVVTARQSVIMRCERISPEQYAAHRKTADAMTALLDQELVVKAPNPRASR